MFIAAFGLNRYIILRIYISSYFCETFSLYFISIWFNIQLTWSRAARNKHFPK